jgi:hypothetical protein
MTDKDFDRAGKILALAARRQGNEQEAKLAGVRFYDMLDRASTLRYCVTKGASVRIIPQDRLNMGTAVARDAMRQTVSRRQEVFFDHQRVKDEHSRKAAEAGFLTFLRHGYLIFVPYANVQIFR